MSAGGLNIAEEYLLLEISKMSSMISNNERAKLWTKSKLSRCDRSRSLSRVNSVIPMIPFIGVLRRYVSGAADMRRANLPT